MVLREPHPNEMCAVNKLIACIKPHFLHSSTSYFTTEIVIWCTKDLWMDVIYIYDLEQQVRTSTRLDSIFLAFAAAASKIHHKYI